MVAMAFRNSGISEANASSEPIVVFVAGGPESESGSLSAAQAPQLGLRVVRALLDAEDLEARIESAQPDVLLIDCLSDRLREASLALLRSVRKSLPAVKCILSVDEFDMDFSVSAFQRGARGLIVGNERPATLVAKCIRCVYQGQIWISNDVLVEVIEAFSKSPSLACFPSRPESQLSPREHEVMTLVIQGMSNREIADILRVTENTVKKYVYEVFNKTGASNRVELVLRALRSEVAA